MNAKSTLFQNLWSLKAKTGVRLMSTLVLAVTLAGCSMTPCQEADADPEADQQRVAKDLAIPPDLLNPAIDNKPFNEAIKPAS